MAGSSWNALLDRLLAADLTANEYRVVLALGRLLLGWNQTSGHLGRALIRETAGGMDGRSFARALDGLVTKHVVEYMPGGVGKGNRGHYTLLLADTSEKAAPERPFADVQKAAPERPKAAKPKGRAGGTQKAAPERLRRGRGKGKNPALRAASPDKETFNQVRQDAFAAYVSTGGSVELERFRGALASAVTAAVNAGTETTLILAACRDLGRDQAFPGHLKRRIAELEAAGGPCRNRGAVRAALTAAQLRECGCHACAEWAGPEPTTSTAGRAA